MNIDYNTYLLDFIKKSEWINDEKLKDKVISNFIDTIKEENLIGKIKLGNYPLEQISSSNEKLSSSKVESSEFNKNDECYDYPMDIPDYSNFVDKTTGETSNPSDSQNELNDYDLSINYSEDLLNAFKNIKDNDNPDNTIILRKNAFENFMNFFQLKFNFSS